MTRAASTPAIDRARAGGPRVGDSPPRATSNAAAGASGASTRTACPPGGRPGSPSGRDAGGGAARSACLPDRLLRPARRLLVALAALALAAGCGGSDDLFAYDESAPLGLRVVEETTRDGVVVSDVVFETPERRVAAYLVGPAGDASGGAVLFLHWLEVSAETSNRTEFLPEAEALAREGVVSLLPDQFFPWDEKPSDPESDRERVVRQVVEHRRALDLLASRPGVDPDRIAVVGHDYGGMYGSLLARFDGRPAAYVLMAVDADFPNWFVRYFVPSRSLEEYEQAFAGLNPVDVVGDAAPAGVFFQFGESDPLVPPSRTAELFESAGEPKRLERYGGGHELDERARADRLAWLRDELGS